MMAWVHAAVGAAIGGRVRSRRSAVAFGIFSHLMADLVPHRDYDLPVEVPLLAGTLAFLAWRHGIRSPQVAGALGGVLPDVENGLERIGVTSGTLFPTHTKKPWFIGHGRRVKSPLPQIVLAVLCLFLAE